MLWKFYTSICMQLTLHVWMKFFISYYIYTLRNAVICYFYAWYAWSVCDAVSNEELASTPDTHNNKMNSSKLTHSIITTCKILLLELSTLECSWRMMNFITVKWLNERKPNTFVTVDQIHASRTVGALWAWV